MSDINALNIVTNSEFLDVTATSSSSSEQSSGVFELFMRAESGSSYKELESAKEGQGEVDFSFDDSAIEDDDAIDLESLKDIFLAKIFNSDSQEDEDGTGIGSEDDEQDSRCDDFGLQSLADEIVGIIEGFGLLDYNTDESVLDEISEKVASLLNQATVEQVGAEIAEGQAMTEDSLMLFDEIARMPNADDYQTLSEEAMKMIEEAVSEYQCSFDNTNSTGVKNNTADMTEQTMAEPGTAEDSEFDAQSIKDMLKSAIQKASAADGEQVRAADSELTHKAADDDGSADNVLRDGGFSAENKVSFETLETSETESTQDAQNVSQEDIDENIAKITEKITASQADGKNEFDVELKPEFLGKLSIKLIMDSDGIKAQIKAGDQYVKGLISEQLPELSQTLKEKGVNMTNIEVVYDSPMFTSTEQQFQGQSQFSGNANGGTGSYISNESEIEDIFYNAGMDLSELMLINSSVEFTA